MRVAYLMNGIIGGIKPGNEGGKNYNATDLNKDIKEKIIKHTSNTHQCLHNEDIEIDYFIFSWQPELEKTYIQQYNPIKIKSVPQIIFEMPDHFQNEKENIRIQSTYSRWYSAKKIMEMCKQHCIETQIEYDLVINTRLDLCWHWDPILVNLSPTHFHISGITNNPKYNWPHNIELIDHLFVSNFNYMYKFLQMYDFLNEYTKPDECPSWKKISSHFLCVWHLRKIGLLKPDIIKESFNTLDLGYDPHVDYHLFRDKINPFE